MKSEIEVCELPKFEGSEVEPVAFRVPVEGELFVNKTGENIIQANDGWDEPRLIVKKKRWVPGMVEPYFFIDAILAVDKKINCNHQIDRIYLDQGNCYQTREEAEAAAEKIKLVHKGEL